MYKEQIIEVKPTPFTNAISRRGVGKAVWKRVIENLIISEKEDIKDMAILRRLLGNNVEGLKLLAEMQERKTIRVIELNDLLHYSDKESGLKDKRND
jgi:hypothetical protein